MTERHSRPRPWLPSDRVLVCDGAMGTMLHSAGIPLGQSVSELNLTQPRLVGDLHAAYVAAGADILQTNTFDANRVRLAHAGLEDRVAEINIAGARLAREAAQAGDRAEQPLVAGSVGPIQGALATSRMRRAERAAALREQISALADWVDILVLETFGDIDGLLQAIDVSRSECDVAVIAQMTFGDDGRTLRGETPAEVAAALNAADVAAFGANCTVGPAVLVDVVAELAASASLPISVQPNAGTPRRIGRGLRYAHNTAYFAAAATQLVAAGASIVGGCCGTTPGHIRAVSAAVAGLPARPLTSHARTTPRSTVAMAPRVPPPAAEPVSWPERERPVVLAGLPTPRGSEVSGYLESARSITEAGADMLAIVDPETSTSRVSPVAAAVLLIERISTTVVLPVEAAGRSLPALQADLLGAHAFGLRTVVCRSGTPRYAGDYPDPGSSSEVDSLRLIAALTGLNDGVDWRGVPMPDSTRFVIGASLDVSAADRDFQVDRAVAKVAAGAHFLVTDIVLDPGQARETLLDIRARGISVPIILAVAPFRDARTVARLTHETPEVQVRRALLRTEAEQLDATVELVEKLLDEVAGVLVHGGAGPDRRMLQLVAQLSAICRTSTERPAT